MTKDGRGASRRELPAEPRRLDGEPYQVSQTTWGGHEAVMLSTEAMCLICVIDTGPRIAFFGRPSRDNLLFWDEGNPLKGRPQKRMGKDDWTLRGGHRLWLSPHLADEAALTYHSDDASCDVSSNGSCLWVMAAADSFAEVRKGFGFRVVDAATVEVVHVLQNVGEMLAAYGLWALTCTRPRERTSYVIPLGDGSEWDTVSVTLYRRWAGDGPGHFAENQFSMREDAYVLEPRGLTTKRALLNPAGVIAMIEPDEHLTFTIEAEFEPGRQYPASANQAMYVGKDNFMVEMETMGPLVQLKPGQKATHVERWKLHEGACDRTGAAVRNLLR